LLPHSPVLCQHLPHRRPKTMSALAFAVPQSVCPAPAFGAPVVLAALTAALPEPVLAVARAAVLALALLAPVLALPFRSPALTTYYCKPRSSSCCRFHCRFRLCTEIFLHVKITASFVFSAARSCSMSANSAIPANLLWKWRAASVSLDAPVRGGARKGQALVRGGVSNSLS
jgi:hypothetical protein